MGWWVAEKGDPLAYAGPTEVNQEAAKRVAIAKSKASPGPVFEVRYHINANAPAEVRWEAVGGELTEVTGGAAIDSARKPMVEQSGGYVAQSGPSDRAAPVVPKTEKEMGSVWQTIRGWFS